MKTNIIYNTSSEKMNQYKTMAEYCEIANNHLAKVGANNEY